jgi:high-affinity iron transporter
VNLADGASAPSIAVQLADSGLIGVREGLETGIVVESLKWVAVGVTAAVAMITVIFLGIHFGTSTVSGVTAELIAGIASLIAVGIVTWMVLWMRTAARSISGELRADMRST